MTVLGLRTQNKIRPTRLRKQVLHSSNNKNQVINQVEIVEDSQTNRLTRKN